MVLTEPGLPEWLRALRRESFGAPFFRHPVQFSDKMREKFKLFEKLCWKFKINAYLCRQKVEPLTPKTMTTYVIFKTDNLTGKTINICGGSHETEQDCKNHWQAYMYGFYDEAVELLGSGNFQFMEGSRPLSFHLSVDNKKDVEYFMLLGDEGPALIHELCKLDMI